MSTSYDPRDDLTTVVDSLQRVQLLRGGQTPDPLGTIRALRRDVSQREATASNGKLLADDAIWHLAATDLTDPPRIADAILDAGGQRWTIVEVRDCQRTGRWRVAARCLELAFELDDRVSVLEAVYNKSPGGAAEVAWRTWRSGVGARVQPLESAAEVEDGARRTAARYRVLLAESLEIGPQHRIQAADGTTYRVLRVCGAERLAAPLTIEVEALP